MSKPSVDYLAILKTLRRPLEEKIGIGGAVARSPLPHHRTYGAVYGGSVS
jgi:hypothetical protein